MRGKTSKSKIVTVKENSSNPHFVTRNIITRGAVILTDAGLAKVQSRPGQDGVVNAVLLEAPKAEAPAPPRASPKPAPTTPRTS